MDCQQCGFTQHVEGKFCNNCGAALPASAAPAKSKGLSTRQLVGIIILVGLFFMCGVGGLLMNASDPRPSPSSLAAGFSDVNPSVSPTVKPLSAEETRELLRVDYEQTMKNAHQHLNFIKARLTKNKAGFVLMARHSYFSQYTLKIGGTAGIITDWMNANESDLKKAKIVRVGVESDEAYGGASWFDVK